MTHKSMNQTCTSGIKLETQTRKNFQ